MRRAWAGIALALSVLVVSGCGSDKRPPKVLPRISSTEVAVGKEIRLTPAGPVPRHLVAGPGDTITWRNDTAAPMVVRLIDGSKPSASVPPGAVFSHLFPTSGSFAYRLGAQDDVKGYIEINLPGTVPAAGTR